MTATRENAYAREGDTLMEPRLAQTSRRNDLAATFVSGTDGLATPIDGAATVSRAGAGKGLTRLAFLRRVAAAVTAVGIAELARAPRPASATYIPGSPQDIVNTDLQVQGNLVVTSPNRMGIGAASPQGTLDVAGEVRVTNGGVSSIAITAEGKGSQTYFVQGPQVTPVPAYTGGTWGSVKQQYTWADLAPPAPSMTWQEVGTVHGTWQRVGSNTWQWLRDNKTWSQVQQL